MTKTIVIPVTGPIRHETIDANQIETYQKQVRGYIEIVHLYKETFSERGKMDRAIDPIGSIYVNEEGIRLKLPKNLRATMIVDRHALLHPDSVILGDVIIVGPGNGEGDDTDYTDELGAILGIKL